MHRPRRKHLDVLSDRVALAGLQAVDVGCGDGSLVRALARRGASVLGVDPGLDILRKAAAWQETAGGAYVAARAEALPLADGSVDLVLFFNSLHHVPVDGQPEALSEAGRVLAPHGMLYVMEPLAEGPYFELVRPVEDETDVRAAAYRAIRDAVDGGRFREIGEDAYQAPIKHTGFEIFRQRIIDVDPARATTVAKLEDSLRAGFAAAAEPVDDGFLFWQPSRVNLLRPAGPGVAA